MRVMFVLCEIINLHHRIATIFMITLHMNTTGDGIRIIFHVSIWSLRDEVELISDMDYIKW